jgi:hypothetical protein
MRQIGPGVILMKLLKFLLDLMVKSEIVVLLIVGDDLIGVEVSIFEFLMMAATLQRIPGADEVGHLFVEFADSE